MIDETTKQVFDKAFELVKQGVVAAADTLRTYAPQLWAMVRRQVIIEGFECLVGGFLILLAGCSIIYLVRRKQEERPDYSGECFDKNDANIATGFILVITAACVTGVWMNAADMLLNPDYWTLKVVLALRGQ